MTNIFDKISKRALDVMSDRSDGAGLYDNGVDTPVSISAILNRDVELIGDDGGVFTENTIDIPSMKTVIGASITLGSRAWIVGRTISDDGSTKVVIVE